MPIRARLAEHRERPVATDGGFLGVLGKPTFGGFVAWSTATPPSAEAKTRRFASDGLTFCSRVSKHTKSDGGQLTCHMRMPAAW